MEYLALAQVLYAGLAGAVAAACMGQFVLVCHRMQLTAVNPIEAIGTRVQGSYDHAYRMGWICHLLAGMLFGIIYSVILRPIVGNDSLLMVVGGATIGVVHGFVASFFVAIEIGEFGKYEEFRNSYTALCLIYIAAHVLFGTILGLLLPIRF